MMNRLKKRFVKDYSLPISLYQEPYFTNRIELLEDFLQTKTKWNLFLEEVSTFNNYQDYFEHYNEIKDRIINYIQSKPQYQKFINYDMNKYAVNNQGVGNHSIFKPTNDGKTFLSFDLKKANFQSFSYFDAALIDNADSYEEFISQFTSYKHIIESKYIRQVIFGALNPKRQVTIEKYLMKDIFEFLIDVFDKERIQTYMHDEIVVDISDISEIKIKSAINMININCVSNNLEVKVEKFILKKIPNYEYYIQYFEDGTYKFKCVPDLFYTLLYKQFNKLEVTEEDLVFYHEGFLSKFLEVPQFEI